MGKKKLAFLLLVPLVLCLAVAGVQSKVDDANPPPIILFVRWDVATNPWAQEVFPVHNYEVTLFFDGIWPGDPALPQDPQFTYRIHLVSGEIFYMISRLKDDDGQTLYRASWLESGKAEILDSSGNVVMETTYVESCTSVSTQAALYGDPVFNVGPPYWAGGSIFSCEPTFMHWKLMLDGFYQYEVMYQNGQMQRWQCTIDGVGRDYLVSPLPGWVTIRAF